MPPSNRPSTAHAEALEARFALRVTSRLHDGAETLPHDITERLRIARHQALEAAAQSRLGTQTQPERASTWVLTGTALAGAPGVAGGMPGPMQGSFQASVSRRDARHREADHGKHLDDNPPSWGWRLASALPAMALVAGLWLIGAWHQREQVQAASEIDMALLTDDLPPSAYADPGFEEYLRSASESGQPNSASEQQARPEPIDLLPEIDTEPASQESGRLPVQQPGAQQP